MWAKWSICHSRSSCDYPAFKREGPEGSYQCRFVESPSLEIFKTWHYGPKQQALVAPALSRGVLHVLQRSRPVFAILWILQKGNFEDMGISMSFFLHSQLKLSLPGVDQITNIPVTDVRWSNNENHTNITQTISEDFNGDIYWKIQMRKTWNINTLPINDILQRKNSGKTKRILGKHNDDWDP